MSTELSTDSVESFEENGYVVIEEAFDPKEVAAMEQAADDILELLVNSSIANDRTSERLDFTRDDDTQTVRKAQPINDLSLTLTAVAEDERFLGPLSQVMDDDPVLMEEKLNYKQPLPEPVEGLEAREDDSGFLVHTDYSYFKEQGYSEDIVSSAICIDDCTVDNGPIEVWPGTHRDDVTIEHVERGGGLTVKRVSPDDVDYDAGKKLTAPAGSVLLFHSRLVHASSANTSGAPRRLMIYSHYPATEGENRVPDERNAPTRLQESPYEWEYQRMKDRGEFEDRFEAPEF